MKLVTAIIQPHRLAEVKEALKDTGVRGMTICDATGFGRQKGHTEVYRGTEYAIDTVPKSRLEVLTADEDAGAVVAAIVQAARSGTIGDGKVWVTAVEQVVRVRTGASGPDAL